MSTWKGVSHARMTRSMHALRGGEYKVLAAVRRLVPDGERRKLSQADIARRAGVSEGTVSEAMKQLDGPYLRRHFLGRGRGRGYEIEMLPPPEQQLPLPLDTPRKGSESDPCNRSFSDGSPMPQTPPQKGSESDPSLLMSHAHEQQQQGGSLPQADTGNSGQASQLAPETIAALKVHNCHEKVIREIAQTFPGLRPEDVTRAYGILEERASRRPVDTLEGLLFAILRDGQMPTPPRPRPEAPPADKPPRERQKGRRGVAEPFTPPPITERRREIAEDTLLPTGERDRLLAAFDDAGDDEGRRAVLQAYQAAYVAAVEAQLVAERTAAPPRLVEPLPRPAPPPPMPAPMHPRDAAGSLRIGIAAQRAREQRRRRL